MAGGDGEGTSEVVERVPCAQAVDDAPEGDDEDELETPFSGVPADGPEAYKQYMKRLAKKVQDATWKRDEVSQWLRRHEGGAADVEAHVAAVFAASSSQAFVVDRARQLASAMQRHQRLLDEKKTRKRDRLLAAAKVHTAASKVGGPFGIADAAVRGTDVAGAAPKPVEESSSAAALEETVSQFEAPGAALEWSEIERFKSHEDALRFVLKCQPFDYVPEKGRDTKDAQHTGCQRRGSRLTIQDDLGLAACNRDALLDPVQRAMRHCPLPTEFTSTVGDFKRRLRIRHVAIEEERGEPRKDGGRAWTRPTRRTHGDADALGSKTLERKPYVVEGAGGHFDRPTSLRALREAERVRYYIAVGPDVEKRVLAEGFRVRSRTSIPCSATPQEAIARFKESEARCERQPCKHPSVLTVVLPPHVDVVAHKDGGFMIRARELPPSCFKDRKKTENS
mmetsp:Transcript_61726/g.172425  ORF Transcript_61726/g.172425 Transcript_61726/m.172425 type:complete len:451 (-) Transcript_61726:144-1496(-)